MNTQTITLQGVACMGIGGETCAHCGRPIGPDLPGVEVRDAASGELAMDEIYCGPECCAAWNLERGRDWAPDRDRVGLYRITRPDPQLTLDLGD